MRKLIAFTLALAVASVMLLALFQVDGAIMSARCATAAMGGPIVVAFALTVGAGATDSVTLMKGGIRGLVDALPNPARRRLAFRRAATFACSAFAGVLSAYAIALVVAAIMGSPPSWQALALLPLAAAVLVTAATLGWFVGVIGRSWFIPPLLVVGSFVMVSANIGYARAPLALFGASPPISAYLTPSIAVYSATLCFVVAGAIAFGVALVWWASRWRKIVIVALVCVLAGNAGAFMVMQSTLGDALTNDTLNVPDSMTDWPCRESSEDSVSVCIPPDQVRDIDLVARGLKPLEDRLVLLDQALTGRTWRVVDEPAGTSLVYRLPLGREFSAFDQSDTVISELFWNCLIREYPDDRSMELLFSLQQWVGETNMEPNGLEAARVAYRELTKCA